MDRVENVGGTRVINYGIFYQILFYLADFNCIYLDEMKGVTSIVGAVATDMGILTTPQLHWMVRARNKGLPASEQDYFEQLSSSFRLDQCRHCYGSR